MKKIGCVSLVFSLFLLAACGKSENLNKANSRTTPPAPGDGLALYANWKLGVSTNDDVEQDFSIRIDKGVITNFVTCKYNGKTATTYAQSKVEITDLEIRVLETVTGPDKTVDTKTCSITITKMKYRYQFKNPNVLTLTDEKFTSQDLSRDPQK